MCNETMESQIQLPFPVVTGSNKQIVAVGLKNTEIFYAVGTFKITSYFEKEKIPKLHIAL